MKGRKNWDTSAFRYLFGSVRARLALWNMLVLALALIGSGALLQSRVAADLAQGIDSELRTRARQASRFSPLGRPDDAKELIRMMRRGQKDHPQMTADSDESHPRLLDASGRDVVSRRRQLWGLDEIRLCLQTGNPRLTTVEEGPNGEPYRVYTVPLPEETQRSFLNQPFLFGAAADKPVVWQLAIPLAGIRRTLEQLARTLFALVPVALLIAGAGAVFLTDRALRPVRAMTRAAAEIEAQDLSARLATGGNGDEFGRLAEQFNGMLDRLQEAFGQLGRANERQRRFVADASHELRTPLTVIKANTSLALADPDLPTEQREVLEEIDHAASRTIRIARDLLLLARADSEQLIMEPVETPVRDLLEQARREGQRLHPKGALVSVKATGDEPENPLTVWADRHHLTRLLINLTDNALRHTPANGSVMLYADGSDPQTLLLEVRDTGEGISDQHLPNIAERFYRADSSRAREAGGSGLGLAIVSSITEAHGGTLTIESRVGEGTTVRVALPRQVPCIVESFPLLPAEVPEKKSAFSPFSASPS